MYLFWFSHPELYEKVVVLVEGRPAKQMGHSHQNKWIYIITIILSVLCARDSELVELFAVEYGDKI